MSFTPASPTGIGSAACSTALPPGYPRVIHTVDAIAGAGKTYSAVTFAGDHAMDYQAKTLIVQPSMLLMEQTEADLRARFPSVWVTVVHSRHNPRGAVAAIIAHSREARTRPGGEVLIITHAAFQRLRYFAGQDQWHVVCDEIPQVTHSEDYTLRGSHYATYLKLEATARGALFADLAVKRNGVAHLSRIARDNSDPVMRSIATKLLSPHWHVQVKLAEWKEFTPGFAAKHEVTLYARLLPTVFAGWKSVTVMGAGFKDSLLYRLWLMEGVEFRPHKPITRDLRTTAHTNGHFCTIHYAIENDWSKRLRDQQLDADGVLATTLELIRHAAGAVFGQKPFAVLQNKDVAADFFVPDGVVLPNSPHGINCYQHLHNVLIVAALNPQPVFFAWMQSLGLDAEEIRTAGYRQSVYQAVMRISLRNPDDMTPKHVVVPDKATAEWLAGLLPGAQVKALAMAAKPAHRGAGGRPKGERTSADRVAAHRAAEKLRLGLGVFLPSQVEDVPSGAKDVTESLYNTYSVSVTGSPHSSTQVIGLSTFESKFDQYPVDVLPYTSHESFIQDLRNFSTMPLPTKEGNNLFSPSIFDPLLSNRTKRGRANVKAAAAIVLDNDGGDMTRDQFAALFPSLRMAIFNSFSSKPDAERWRVFIPVSNTMSAEVYRYITMQIMQRLVDAGFRDPKWIKKHGTAHPSHGFDTSKVNAENLFYLPCQAAGGPAASFFEEHAGKGRAVLPVLDWINHPITVMRPEPEITPYEPPAPPPMPEMPKGASRKTRKLRAALHEKHLRKYQFTKKAKVEEAIGRWHMEGCRAGEGDAGFFVLTRQLLNAGCDEAEARGILDGQASFANTPADRRKQIIPAIRWCVDHIRALADS
ncbi:MAG: DEAD/DEAH box helicase family protein [Janthinobacterium lividum]